MNRRVVWSSRAIYTVKGWSLVSFLGLFIWRESWTENVRSRNQYTVRREGGTKEWGRRSENGCRNFETYGKDRLCKAVLSSLAKIAPLFVPLSPYLSRNVVIQVSAILCSLPRIVLSFAFCIMCSARMIAIVFVKRKNWNYFFLS